MLVVEYLSERGFLKDKFVKHLYSSDESTIVDFVVEDKLVDGWNDMVDYCESGGLSSKTVKEKCYLISKSKYRSHVESSK